MKLFSLTLLISVVCCFLSSCNGYDYKVIVDTGCEDPSDDDLGKQGKVYITLYGEKGNSPKILLDNEGKPEFKGCTIDTFSISTGDIGNVSKIRIEFDNTELTYNDNLYLTTVALLDETRKLEHEFQWWIWLRTTVEQKTASAENDKFQKKPTIDYKVTVETGDEEDAGTNGKVYITLVGMDDQSRRILLDHEGKPEFQRGQTDTFNITIGVIEDVHVIGVELDSSAESDNPDNWLLKAVSLEDLTQKSAQSFPYDNWLTPTEENSTASVEIELSNPITEYEVIVKTGNKKDAGTLGQVYITIYGEKGHSRKIHLNHGGDSDFQKGQIDKFYIRTTKDIGHANKIRIELDSTEESQSDNWFLERVSVTDIRLDKKYRFPWKKWLTPTADQKTISVEIPLSPKLI